MSKFKVGDKVRLIEDYERWSKGLVGIVNNVQNTFNSEVDGTDMIYTDTFFGVYSFRVELVKEPKVKNMPVFTPMPELKTGMRLVTKEGTEYIYIKDIDSMFRSAGWTSIGDTDKTTGKCNRFPEWSIIKIYDSPSKGNFLNYAAKGDLLWEYKEPEIIKTEADLLREQLDVLKAKLRELGEEE